MSTTTSDGRSLRWENHRAQRRDELVDATMRAIRAHGAGVGMDDIAATASTSKTVLYRHFTDRSGLYAAVAERVDRTILRDVTAATDSRDRATGGGRGLIGAAIDAYLLLVENEPEIYRFVVAAPLLDSTDGDPSGPVTRHIAEQISELLQSETRVEAARARVWAHSVVGMVRAAADDWLTQAPTQSRFSRSELADLLTDLAWSGLSEEWG